MTEPAHNGGELEEVSPESVMRSRHFRRGFEHARVGRGFDTMDTYQRGDQDDYELGRLFASLRPDIRRFKHGRALNPRAVRAFTYAWCWGEFT